jgi:hypothetical protein
LTRTFTPRHLRILVDFILSKRVRQSLVRTFYPWRDKRFSRTLPPTFLFLKYSIFKEQTSQTRCRGPLRFWLRGLLSVAHAALLNFAEGRFRSELLRRQRRAALVVEAYIVGGRSKCQQRFRTFLNFLRRKSRNPLSIADCRCGMWISAFSQAAMEPYCRRIAVRHQSQRRGPARTLREASL